jgi:hypothetical protein
MQICPRAAEHASPANSAMRTSSRTPVDRITVFIYYFVLVWNFFQTTLMNTGNLLAADVLLIKYSNVAGGNFKQGQKFKFFVFRKSGKKVPEATQVRMRYFHHIMSNFQKLDFEQTLRRNLYDVPSS